MTFINDGNPNYVDKLVNFEKMVRLNISSNMVEYDSLFFTFLCICQIFIFFLLLFLQRMIAKTVKIVRGCRSQPYSK